MEGSLVSDTADGLGDRFAELSQFLGDFFKELDRDGEKVTDFYTPDGVFSVGGRAFEGHDGIRGFYADRLERVREQGGGVRTSRHTFVNLRIAASRADRATLEFISLTYAGDGPPPIGGSPGPSVVSDCRLECLRGPSGKWLIERFEGDAIFIGGDPLMNRMALNR